MAKLIFPKRIPEPKAMGIIEQKAFEQFSKEKYKQWHFPLIELIQKKRIKRDLKILDVGCGPGLLIKDIRVSLPDAKLYGIDLANSALRLAKKNNKKVKFQKARVEKLPFESSFFDVVISKDSFHEYENPKIALKEMYRVVKEGGIIIIQDLRRDLPSYLIKRVTPPTDVFKKLIYYSTRASYTKNEIVNLLKQVGINKYKISTRKVTSSNIKKYKKQGINLKLLKESFQSRFTLVVSK